MKKLHKGFTLIELMIVVAIIGILAALAIPNFIRFQARSKQSEVKANLKALLHRGEGRTTRSTTTYSSCIKKIGFSPERGNRYRYTVNTTVRADETCNTAEARADAAGVTSLPTDGEVLADTFKHGTGAASPLANAAKPAPIYAPVAPAGTTITVAANLVGVTPILADAERLVRRGRARRHRQRHQPGPLVRLERLFDHRGYLPACSRGNDHQFSGWRAEEYLQRRELPVSPGYATESEPHRGQHSAMGFFLSGPERHLAARATIVTLSRNDPMSRKGFTLVELMIVVAVIGVLAALAVPNYIRFQARSKQSEAKGTLKAAFTTERAYYQEHSTYSSCTKKLGFAPERGNRYRYTLNSTTRVDETCNTSENRATAAGASLPTDGDILADTFKHGTGVGITAANAIEAGAGLPPGPALRDHHRCSERPGRRGPEHRGPDWLVRRGRARGYRQRRPA